MTFRIGDVYRRMSGDHGHYYMVYRIDESIHVLYFFGNWDEGYVNESFHTFEQKEFENLIANCEHLEFDEQFVAKVLLLSKKNGCS